MILSKSKNFAYIHIEKTGGTSIEEALTPYIAWDDIIFGGLGFGNKLENVYGQQYGYRYMSENALSKHSTAQQIHDYVGLSWDNLYKFATVRDPKEIMTSFYFYIKKNIESFTVLSGTNNVFYNKDLSSEIMINGSTIYTDDLRNLYFIESQLDGSGIDGFIYRMIKSKMNEISPQLSKVDNSVELFDINNIGSNWKNILKNLNISDDVTLEIINKSNRDNSIKLNTESLSLIHSHFSVDYSLMPESIIKGWI